MSFMQIHECLPNKRACISLSNLQCGVKVPAADFGKELVRTNMIYQLGAGTFCLWVTYLHFIF